MGSGFDLEIGNIVVFLYIGGGGKELFLAFDFNTIWILIYE